MMTTTRNSMPKRRRSPSEPQRGEIWIVNFNSPMTAKTPSSGTPKSQWPTTGDEINKVRPAVVMSFNASWEYDLHIVVPLRRWRARFQRKNYFWIVPVPRVGVNNLSDDSGADTFQVKSVSNVRFRRRIGMVAPVQLQLIANTVAFCIGNSPPISNSL